MYIRGSSQTYPTYEEYENSGKYNKKQLLAIEKAFQYRLSPKAISILANPMFNYDQMRQIFGAFFGGAMGMYGDVDDYHWPTLNIRQILIFADPKFDAHQMAEIRTALADGMSEDEVRLFAHPEYCAIDMSQFKSSIDSGAYKWCNNYYGPGNFNIQRMSTVDLYMDELNDGSLSEEELEFAADPKFDTAQMYQILRALTTFELYLDEFVDMCGATKATLHNVSSDDMWEQLHRLEDDSFGD